MGWFSNDDSGKKPSKPPKDPSEVTPEQLDKLLEGMKKKDPKEKNEDPKPKKGFW